MTVIRQPASAGKWDRLIRLSGASTLRNLTLDGNRWNRGPHLDYELEQSHLVVVHDGTFTLDGLLLRDSAGDGIDVGANTIATITNVTSQDCFRGGVVIVNGPCSVTIDNYQGLGDRDIIQIESNNTEQIDLTITSSTMPRIEVQAWGTVDVSDSTINAGLWIDGRGGGSVIFTDCDIGLVDGRWTRRIYYPRNVTFRRCHFAGAELHLYPEVLDRAFENGLITFEDCTFVGSGDQAIYNFGDSVDRGNTVAFVGTNTFSGFTIGYSTRPGWFASVEGSMAPA